MRFLCANLSARVGRYGARCAGEYVTKRSGVLVVGSDAEVRVWSEPPDTPRRCKLRLLDTDVMGVEPHWGRCCAVEERTERPVTAAWRALRFRWSPSEPAVVMDKDRTTLLVFVLGLGLGLGLGLVLVFAFAFAVEFMFVFMFVFVFVPEPEPKPAPRASAGGPSPGKEGCGAMLRPPPGEGAASETLPPPPPLPPLAAGGGEDAEGGGTKLPRRS